MFHTAGEPPSSGNTSLATIGWTMNTSAALVKTAITNRGGVLTVAARSPAGMSVMALESGLKVGDGGRCWGQSTRRGQSGR